GGGLVGEGFWIRFRARGKIPGRAPPRRSPTRMRRSIRGLETRRISRPPSRGSRPTRSAHRLITRRAGWNGLIPAARHTIRTSGRCARATATARSRPGSSRVSIVTSGRFSSKCLTCFGGDSDNGMPQGRGTVQGAVATWRLGSGYFGGARSLPLPVPYRWSNGRSDYAGQNLARCYIGGESRRIPRLLESDRYP